MSHEAAHGYAKCIAQQLAQAETVRYVTVADPAKRAGRIFIDYLRNGRGTTAGGVI
jgi:bifunctional non-homologous end joining protein LigD